MQQVTFSTTGDVRLNEGEFQRQQRFPNLEGLEPGTETGKGYDRLDVEYAALCIERIWYSVLPSSESTDWKKICSEPIRNVTTKGRACLFARWVHVQSGR